MKPLLLSLALAGAIALTGCSSLVSLNPFVTDKEAVMDPALVGTWTNPEGTDTYSISQDGAGYAIRYSSGSDVYLFKAQLMMAGDAKVLDLVSANEDAWQLPFHTPVRVWIEGDTLRVAFLQSDWLKQKASEQVPTVAIDDKTLITASSEAVRDFFMGAGSDPEACGEPDVLTRQQ
jgi:hypothetical protein